LPNLFTISRYGYWNASMAAGKTCSGPGRPDLQHHGKKVFQRHWPMFIRPDFIMFIQT
jgi:hypothetical protein